MRRVGDPITPVGRARRTSNSSDGFVLRILIMHRQLDGHMP